MTVSSDTPGVQFYSGNYVNDVPGKQGAIYKQRQALCLETQHYPDSVEVDQDKFPEFAKGRCHILRPGAAPYSHNVVYSFGNISVQPNL